jgi:hypothetical protein
MLRLQSIICFLVGGLLAASTAYADAGTRPTQETAEERLDRIDEFVWGGRLFLMDRPTLQHVRGLSSLLKEKIEKAPNRHSPQQIDEYQTLTFEGLELYGRVTPTQEFQTITTVITSAKWKVRNGLNVGTNASRIETLLGPPLQRTNKVLRYEGESERVNFYVEKGIIKKVEFWDYVD